MPANSGALTGTIAHKHSALSADGGFLDDGVTGVTGSANGSLLYFDGSSIAQDLPAGNLNDVLTMGAAVPAWNASTPPTSNYEFLGASSVSAGTTVSVAFSEVAPPSYVIGVWTGDVSAGQGNDIEINADSSSLYDQIGFYQLATTPTYLSTLNQVRWNGVISSISGVGSTCRVEVHTNPERSECYAFIDAYVTDAASGAQKGYSILRGQLSSAQTGITQIRFFSGSNMTGTLNCWAVRN